MNILLVGSGGREHALAWKIAQSPLTTRLVCAPGSSAMSMLGECRPIKPTDAPALAVLAREVNADLVVLGPDASLEAGVADAMRAIGVPCFGHTQSGARIETSKVFLKAFAERHNLPTARHRAFDEAAPAKAFLSEFQPPYVIKSDGLTGGKGVIIADSRRDAEAAIDDMLAGRFGEASARLIIEEFLTGEEASLFALTDGKASMLFGDAQDHKRAYDGDLGPNTGGMGSYSPAPILSDAALAAADERLIRPLVAGMAAEGSPLSGVIYAGLMIENDQPRLVEFNSRFGDPECQVQMLRLESDLVPYLLACATGKLAEMPLPVWKRQAAVCVVMASDGYPESPVTGSIIRGADQDFGPDVTVFHAGTVRDPDGTLRAAGGRVLNVCALGETLAEARDAAYAAVDRINWPGGFYRRDIGWRALNR